MVNSKELYLVDWRDVLNSARISSGSTVINDTDELIILKLADDTKIYMKVNSVSDAEYRYLQKDLCNLVSWSKDGQILFNLDKCKIMHFGNNNPHANPHNATTNSQ